MDDGSALSEGRSELNDVSFFNLHERCNSETERPRPMRQELEESVARFLTCDREMRRYAIAYESTVCTIATRVGLFSLAGQRAKLLVGTISFHNLRSGIV